MDFLDRIRSRAHERRIGSYMGARIGKGLTFLQHDMDVANGSGATVRGDMNDALEALATLSSGATAPSTTYAYQPWADTTAGVLKQRNAANTGWIIRRTLDESFVIARSSNTILDNSDIGKTVRATSTFTQTLTAAATLTDGWYVHYINEGTGTITLDPNGAETIDGVASIVLGPGESCTIFCNGSNFKTGNRSRYQGAIGAGRNITARTNAAAPTTSIDIDADELQLKDSNGNAYVATSVNVTAAITTAGANGLDTGSEASNTWYYGWVIYNPATNTVAGLISASATAPTMPSGYTFKALVTAVRNNASSNFVAYRQAGNEAFYEGSQTALSGGTATTTTAVSLASYVPPIALTVNLGIRPLLTSSVGGACIESLRIEIVSGTMFEEFRCDVLQASASMGNYSQLDIPNISQNVNYYWADIGASTNVQTRSSTIAVHGFKLPMGGE